MLGTYQVTQLVKWSQDPNLVSVCKAVATNRPGSLPRSHAVSGERRAWRQGPGEMPPGGPPLLPSRRGDWGLAWGGPDGTTGGRSRAG